MNLKKIPQHLNIIHPNQNNKKKKLQSYLTDRKKNYF